MDVLRVNFRKHLLDFIFFHACGKQRESYTRNMCSTCKFPTLSFDFYTYLEAESSLEIGRFTSTTVFSKLLLIYLQLK